MKKIILSLTLIAAVFFVNSQNVKVVNNVLRFDDAKVYQDYISNKEDRNNIVKATENLITLQKKQMDNDNDIIPDFLKTILNQDKMFQIGDWLIKLDLENNSAFATSATNENAIAKLSIGKSSGDVVGFTNETLDALDILTAIDKNEITIEQYNNASPEARIRWPWNSCSSADRNKTEKGLEIWKEIDSDKDCSLNNKAYLGMDMKVVYQSAIFYFSLQSKIKSLKACTYSNWVFVPTYNADLYLNGAVKYVVVNSCRNEVRNALTDYAYNNNELSWRSYEGGRGLSKFDFGVRFGIKEVGSSVPYRLSQTVYRIVSGY